MVLLLQGLVAVAVLQRRDLHGALLPRVRDPEPVKEGRHRARAEGQRGRPRRGVLPVGGGPVQREGVRVAVAVLGRVHRQVLARHAQRRQHHRRRRRGRRAGRGRRIGCARAGAASGARAAQADGDGRAAEPDAHPPPVEATVTGAVDDGVVFCRGRAAAEQPADDARDAVREPADQPDRRMRGRRGVAAGANASPAPTTSAVAVHAPSAARFQFVVITCFPQGVLRRASPKCEGPTGGGGSDRGMVRSRSRPAPAHA